MKINYRPEIDGLRAIAVGAVILYHAEITILGYQPFKGGFIGVDIFFVISGYLITSIILKELITQGSFSFLYFYERRIRRIFPALIFINLIFLPFAWIYLFPTNLIESSKSVLYSLAFASNLYFHKIGQIYNADWSLLKPFLHTWSLAIEEQYYIMFPIIILISFKFFKKFLIYILIFGFLISLGLAEWTSREFPSLSFYYLHTRMWELLSGSLLAYFEITKNSRSKKSVYNLFFLIFGLTLIIFSILYLEDNIIHPSIYTLFPIVGTCLIIWFANKDELVTKVLTNKLFVSIGLISYSLYLWHYPIFAFIRITGFGNQNILMKILFIIILLIVSIFTYYFIEKPARNKKFSFKKILIFLIPSIFFLTVVNLVIIEKNGYPKRFEKFKAINLNYNPDNFFLKKETDDVFVENQKFNSKNTNITVIGDSHGQNLAGALQLGNKLNNKINIHFLSKDLEKIYIDDYDLIKNSNLLIFSYRWNDYKLKQLKKNLDKFKNLNKNIAITSRTNEYKVQSKLFTLLDYKIIFNKEIFNYFGLKKLYFDKREIYSNSEINQKLKAFTSNKNLKYLNKEDYMCEVISSECDYLDKNGNKLFYDYGHYTKSGMKFFGEKIYKIDWLKLNY